MWWQSRWRASRRRDAGESRGSGVFLPPPSNVVLSSCRSLSRIGSFLS
uniref:Uncharacterized protein n=1 Tax=Setaria italica TaxID=4555 RepID=K3XU68_SETIT